MQKTTFLLVLLLLFVAPPNKSWADMPALSLSAQNSGNTLPPDNFSSRPTVLGSKRTDNWFVGVSTGASAPSTHAAVLQSMSTRVGVEVGRYFTPAYGLGIQSYAALGRVSGYAHTPLAVKETQILLTHYVNLNNLTGYYSGRPDVFEVTLTAGIGWGHLFTKGETDPHTTNYLTSRVGLQTALNLGRSRAWAVRVEPFLEYRMHGTGTEFQPYFNVNRSHLGLLVGTTYRFRNSNGTHHFRTARLYDQVEVDALNAKINQLRERIRTPEAATDKP